MGNIEGAWIFLSHSTKDWSKVRKVRNLLEKKGHRPLVFFLKCLNDHSELDDLIRREIEARSWFLLCNSENAENSTWVQEEISYIKTLDNKYYQEINLNDSLEEQILQIERLSKRINVFLSYSNEDKAYANRIRMALQDNDYSVWQDSVSLEPGADWKQEITGAIDQAINRGFVLVLMSSKTMQSSFVNFEVQYAMEKASQSTRGVNILPVIMRDTDVVQDAMPPKLQKLLADIKWFKFSNDEDFNTNIDRLIGLMRNHEM